MNFGICGSLPALHAFCRVDLLNPTHNVNELYIDYTRSGYKGNKVNRSARQRRSFQACIDLKFFSEKGGSLQRKKSTDVVERIERYECSGCLANFTRKSALDKHTSDCEDFRLKVPQTVDLSSDIDSFPCKICKKSYSSRQALFSHMKREHNKDTR